MERKITTLCCLAAILLWAITLYTSYKITGCLDLVISTYQNNIKGYVFAAFLGASSFLISLLTFLVTNIKEKMFDSPDYLKIYAIHNKLKTGDYIYKKELYRPLRLISQLLVCAIFFSIITSISQLTLGFSTNEFILIIPTLAPFIAISFLISALTQIYSLIKQWLNPDSEVIEVNDQHV